MFKKISNLCLLFFLILIFNFSLAPVSQAAQVKNLKITETKAKKITLDWKKVSGAEKYQVRVLRKKNSKYKLVKKVKATKSKKTITGLSANHIYYFKVRAYKDGQYGKYSELKKKRTTVSKVKDISLDDSDYSSISLSWPEISGADDYHLKVATLDGQEYTTIQTLDTSESNYTITGLTQLTDYYFKIRASRDDVNGLYSDWFNAATEAPDNFWDEGDDLDGAAQPAVSGILTTANSSGRTGSYYLPAGYNLEAKPVLVLFHGTNGDGDEILNWFSSLAAASDFIIVAPDSRQSPSGDYIWEVGTEEGEVTDDFTHTLDCLSEVDQIAGVSFDSQHIMTAGFSAGGSSAPYLATNDNRFTHFAILHGGVFTGGLGDNQVSGWLSTGDSDTLRTEAMYETYYSQLEEAGFTDLTYQVYSEGHEINSQEKSELIDWWL